MLKLQRGAQKPRRMLDCASVVVTRVKRALRVSKLSNPDTEQQQTSSSTEARYREMPS